MFNQAKSNRRFIGPMGELLAIYDQNRSFTLYGQVEDWSSTTFIPNTIRTYWDDEIREVE